jgi:prepilin-type processing-associated H-X9-DG protein
VWIRPGNSIVLNDTALSGDGRDWFGTFHNTPDGDLNGGTINAVFVDGHVQVVRSALREDLNDRSEMEFWRAEKYAWPFVSPMP